MLGFLTGQEMDWMPRVLPVVRSAHPSAEVVIMSLSSPELAAGLLRGRIDVAFLRPEKAALDLVLGFNTANSSVLLKTFLGRANELIRMVKP